MSRDEIAWNCGLIIGEMKKLDGQDDLLASLCADPEFRYRREVAAIRAAVNEIFPAQPEVTAPAFTETLPDGRVVPLHLSAQRRLQEESRNALGGFFRWWLETSAHGVRRLGYDPGTTLQVTANFVATAAKFDPAFAAALDLSPLEHAVASRPMVTPAVPE